MPKRIVGRTSWYGGPNDSGDNNQPALQGASNKEPGVAVMNRHTLGGWWKVKYPNGKTLTLRQTDLGPAKWTGKALDTNYSAVKAAGYTEKNFPTGGRIHAEYLGKHKRAPQMPEEMPQAGGNPEAMPRATTGQPQDRQQFDFGDSLLRRAVARKSRGLGGAATQSRLRSGGLTDPSQSVLLNLLKQYGGQ